MGSILCDKCGGFLEKGHLGYDCECPKEDSTYKGYKDKYTGYYGQEWQEIRERVLQRDNKQCVECGISQKEHKEKNVGNFGEGLHIHHKQDAKTFDSYENANQLENLETLCAKCHRLK